jgi:hypothetical protein
VTGGPVPLHLPGVSMVGPTGERDNVRRLYEVLTALLPRGLVVVMTVGHDDGCPCMAGDLPLSACTCETVDLLLEPVRPAPVESP